MSILTKVNDKVEDRYYNFKGDCNVIIVHPDTCQEMLKELTMNIPGHQISPNSTNLTYRGISIRRSLDVKVGEVEVY